MERRLVVALVLLSTCTYSHPPVRRTNPPPAFDDTMEWLMRFGYLPESNKEYGNLMTDDQLRVAIKALQRFGNLPESGELDEDTWRLMRRPRCGLPDTSGPNSRTKRFAIHGQKWHKNNITWSLRRTWSGPGADSGGLRVRAELRRALHVWARHSSLTFHEIDSDDADIRVFFERGYHGDGYPFDGRGAILAHAFFPGTGRGGDAHFDLDELWLLASDQHEDGTNLFSVAAHEFGHSLGLSHSSVAGALMYPWYQGHASSYDLPEDDKLGIQQIYGPKVKEWGKNVYGKARPPYDKRPPYVDTPPTYRTTTTTTTTTTTPTTTTTTTTRRPRVTAPTWRPSRPTVPPQPDPCTTSYDAIALIRGDTFMFKNQYVWRVGEKGLYPGYPALTRRLWSDLPHNLTRIDAVYERPNNKIVFFIGRELWVFEGNRLDAEYPLPLTYIGLPSSVQQVDAAMVWGHNSKTYLFYHTMYWRMDEEAGRVELDYPRDMARVWKGVPYYIDAALQWKDGATYFFKGRGFWKFDDTRMRVDRDERHVSTFWSHCPSKPTHNKDHNAIVPDKPKEKPVWRFGHKEASVSGGIKNLWTWTLIAASLCCALLAANPL